MFSTSDGAARRFRALRRVARSLWWTAGLLSLLWLAGCAERVESEVQVAPDGTWKGEARLTFRREPATGAGWEQALDARLREAAAKVLAGRQVDYDLARLEAGDGSVVYTLALRGRDLESLAAILADRDSVVAGLGGPVLLRLRGQVHSGELLEVALPANVATGYGWAMAAGAADAPPQVGRLAELESGPLQAGENGLARQVIRLAVRESGPAEIPLGYQRPWEPVTEPSRLLQIDVGDGDLAPLLAAVGPRRAPDTPAPAARPEAGVEVDSGQAGSLSPLSSFDWCAEGACTPVRDQGGCGSCWAFATVGPLESAIKRFLGLSVDLSEQYLVSCNSDGWSCAGGWWAHDYHRQKYQPPQAKAGAVLEFSFPYRASDVPCSSRYAHPFRIGGWAYVNPSSPFTVPSAAAIKNAISAHGPVTAAICVGSAFQRYSGGVFSTDERGACGGGVNHGIVLVGWNDAEESWILRNSWGASWGEGGYMRIRWGTSLVGYGASYVLAEPPEDDHVPRGYMPVVRKR